MTLILGAAVSIVTPLTPRAALGQSGDTLPRYTAGIDVLYAKPRGTFSQNIKQGWGGDLHGVFYTSPGSPLGLRVNLQALVYGQRDQDYPYTNYFFGGYRLRETTSNSIFALTAGPQFAINGGPFRPYVHAMGGVSSFTTSSSFEALDVSFGYDPYVPSGDTFANDWKLTYGAGAGVAIPLTRGSTQVMLDGGVSYYVNGRTTYLTKGDVSRDPYSGNVTIAPRRSEAHYITYRFGVSVSFGKGSNHD